MRNVLTAAVAVCLCVAPLFAGGLALEIGNPKSDPEALSKNAVLIARLTACSSPGKATITATAEGLIDGKRQSIPLKVLALSTPGTFTVSHEWPHEGSWAVRMVATHPDFKNYASSVLVPVPNDVVQWAGVKHIYRAPTAEEIDAVLSTGIPAHN